MKQLFLGRKGGVSKGPYASLNTSYAVGDDAATVSENRHLAAALFDVLPQRLFVAKQVHGDTIIRIDENSNAQEIADTEADAIWTTLPDTVVAVLTADCVPVVVAHKQDKAVMAIHLGWRGAAKGLARKAVDVLCAELSASPSDFVATIGPCIGYDAYEVGAEVVEGLASTVSTLNGCARQKSPEKLHVDLGAVVARQLMESGLASAQNMAVCTATNTLEYFSHRGDKGLSGRQLSGARLDHG